MRLPFAFRWLLVVLAVSVIGSCAEDTPLDTGKSGGNDTIPDPNPTDTIPPAQITGLSITVSGDVAVFRWIAPHDNEPGDSVAHYEIRFVYLTAGTPVAFWDLAQFVVSPPQPTTPGSPQSYAFSDAEKSKTLWVGIRCYDAEGNRSPNSDLVSIRIPGIAFAGRCVDVFTGDPIEGLAVQVIAGPPVNMVTDSNGEFGIQDISPGSVAASIEQGSAATSYHNVNQVLVVYSDTTHTFAMIPVQQTTATQLQGMSVLAFLKQLTGTNSTPTLLAKWHNYPVPVYVPPFTNDNGVDYETITKSAVQRWMDRTGLALYRFVDSAPDTGVVVVYRPQGEIAPQIAFTRHRVGSDSHPIRDDIHVIDDLNPANENFLYRVMMHEFGHTVRFGHVSDNVFIMFYGQPLPQDISDDEITALLLHHALPTRVDMAIYDEAYP